MLGFVGMVSKARSDVNSVLSLQHDSHTGSDGHKVGKYFVS